MTIVLNGENFQCANDATIADLLIKLDLHQKSVAIEHNKRIIKKSDYDKTALKEGDQVEIVHFVGGG
jgi:sulfur carrier protein